MIYRTSATLITATLAATIVLGGALPANAGPGDWEEYDRVDGLTTPVDIAVHEASSRLYVTEPGDSAIAILDADTLELIDRAYFPGMEMIQIDVDQVSGVVYFVDHTAWQIVRWDPAIAPVATTTFPMGIEILALEILTVSGNPALSSVQWTVYDTADGGNGWLYAATLDLAAYDAVDLGPGVRAAGLAPVIDPDTLVQLTFYTDYFNNLLVTGILPDITVGPNPTDVEAAVTNEGGIFAVVNYGNDTVTVFDGTTLDETTIGVSASPADLELAGPTGPMFLVSEDGFVDVIAAPFTGVGWTIPLGAPSWFGEYSSTLNRFFVAIPDTGEVVSIALTPAATGGGGLADTGTDSTGPMTVLALGLALLGALVMRVGYRRQGVAVEK